MHEVIKARRTELGFTQNQLAELTGLDRRQIRRYEAGEQQPALSVAVTLAEVLKVSVDELAGLPVQRVDLTGQWWASWQTSKDNDEVVTAQEVEMTQRGDHIGVHAVTRGISLAEGGYTWRGEFRLWDNEILIGWYAANESSVRSKGSMYFVMHPHGIHLSGRWVGLSYDGLIMTGWAAVGRSEDECRGLISHLKETKGATL